MLEDLWHDVLNGTQLDFCPKDIPQKERKTAWAEWARVKHTMPRFKCPGSSRIKNGPNNCPDAQIRFWRVKRYQVTPSNAIKDYLGRVFLEQCVVLQLAVGPDQVEVFRLRKICLLVKLKTEKFVEHAASCMDHSVWLCVARHAIRATHHFLRPL
jgi:hypothetical protein